MRSWIGRSPAVADLGSVFRRAVSWLPAGFIAIVDVVEDAPRQFGSTEHLSSEAVAAYVDGELRMNAHLRAARHLALCPQCAGEVEYQSRARAALRDAPPIRIPAALLGQLAQIPECPEDCPCAESTSALPSEVADGVTQHHRRRR